jgi:hypothetical protein
MAAFDRRIRLVVKKLCLVRSWSTAGRLAVLMVAFALSVVAAPAVVIGPEPRRRVGRRFERSANRL